jgi:hypothetical protein
MASASTRRVVIDDLRHGRNGYDPPWAIKDTECADAVNIDFYKAPLGRKRGGMIALATSGITMTGIVSSLARHVPSTDETLAELWAVDDSTIPKINRLAGGVAWTAPTLFEAPSGSGWDFSFASIAGKLVAAYKSASDRLKIWDPVSNQVRFTGIRIAGVAGIASVANTGAGTYPAVYRAYRVRYTEQRAGVTVRRSEYSATNELAPSGTGTALRITQGSPPSEGETHWELEAGVGYTDVVFYRIATMAVATTIYDDSALTTTYSAGVLSAPTGTYSLQSSYKFVAADQNRVLGFGSHTAANKQNRVEASAVIGALNVGDEERVDTTTNYFFDLDENDSGVATGLKGPVLGMFFAFKDRQVWQLTPTGSISNPYSQMALSKKVGAIHSLAIDIGDDAGGQPAIYWMSHRGPYRWGIHGMEYLGHPIEDYVLGGNATINLAATNVTARVIYYPDKRQVWFWWATGAGNDPNVCFFYDIVTEGWTRVPTGDKLANIRCVCLFANTVAAAMSRDLKPYVGQTGAAKRLWKCDTGTDDNGTNYQAYVITKAFEPGGPGFYGAVGDADLLAPAATGVTITATVTADFGEQTKTGTALLTPSAAAETRVTKRVEDTGFGGDVRFVQYQLGDGSAASNAWSLDRLVVPYTRHDAVSA